MWNWSHGIYGEKKNQQNLFVFGILFLQHKTFLARTTWVVFQFYQGVADKAEVHFPLCWTFIPAAILLFLNFVWQLQEFQPKILSALRMICF